MTSRTIIKLITIEAPVDRVWAFVGTADGLRQWWQTESLQIEILLGGAYCDDELFSGMRCSGTVITVQPPHKLAFTLRADQWPADVHTTVSLTLHPRAGYTNHATCTLVTLEHRGLDAIPPEYGCMSREFECFWSTMMPRLTAMFAQ